ncbi:MAG: D-alanyl-D-alanine carboxypeptidase/D-alanyl-D-alanine-endopeptidase [Burkholderiaceae bacterium]|nr:D-alanyl-D-alanine carboxypeptidase/D-alanyl-D-alanine-endopeptidase [Burkholderiaceae bacterium]
MGFKLKRRLVGGVLLGACVWLAGCAATSGGGALPAPVQQALAQAGLSADSLGLVAYSLDEPRSALLHNERRAMQPASTMKLLTTVVALDQLGPNARGHTDLLADAAPQGDTISGPLYLRGGADADLDFAALWQLLSELRERGVRRIEGGLVLDRSLFHPARMDQGLPPFDEAPEFQYNVIPDALQLNGNLLGFALSADGQAVNAQVRPAWAPVDLRSALSLNDKPCAEWEDGWLTPEAALQPDAGQGARMRIELRGSFPRNCSKLVALNLVDRSLLADAAVRSLWAQLGGELVGATREAATPGTASLLATHRGRALAELAWGMNKRSDNPLTRMVYLRLGVDAGKPAGTERTADAAERAVREWFQRQRIDATGLVLDNGSGLSRSERISPMQLAALLQTAHRGLHAPELLASLPIVGVDSPWTRRLKGSPAAGRARIKTGSLRNVAAVAGYVLDARDRTWVLVAFINDERASAGRPALDALIDWVARTGN